MCVHDATRVAHTRARARTHTPTYRHTQTQADVVTPEELRAATAVLLRMNPAALEGCVGGWVWLWL